MPRQVLGGISRGVRLVDCRGVGQLRRPALVRYALVRHALMLRYALVRWVRLVRLVRLVRPLCPVGREALPREGRRLVLLGVPSGRG